LRRCQSTSNTLTSRTNSRILLAISEGTTPNSPHARGSARRPVSLLSKIRRSHRTPARQGAQAQPVHAPVTPPGITQSSSVSRYLAPTYRRRGPDQPNRTRREVKSLNLVEAAEFLRLHPITLLRKAQTGEIPGAKPGKRWVFLDVDLADYLRANYRRQASSDSKEMKHWLSIDERGRRAGALTSPSEDDEYGRALGLTTARRPGNTTTGSRPASGKRCGQTPNLDVRGGKQ
jgi:hypothetical protein